MSGQAAFSRTRLSSGFITRLYSGSAAARPSDVTGHDLLVTSHRLPTAFFCRTLLLYLVLKIFTFFVLSESMTGSWH